MEKKRAGNWSEREKIVLAEEVLKRESVLFGKLKGCGVGGVTVKVKEEAWEDVLSNINAISSEPRSVQQCRKQYDNIKQRAKEKLDEAKRPRTGGGPPLPEPSTSQQLIIQTMGERPGMAGLPINLDSLNPDLSLGIEIDSEETFGRVDRVVEDLDLPVCPKEATPMISTRPSKTEVKSKKRSHSPNIGVLERENLKLENLKLKLEIEKLEEEKNTLIKKRQKLQEEIELINIKKLYYSTKISADYNLTIEQ